MTTAPPSHGASAAKPLLILIVTGLLISSILWASSHWRRTQVKTGESNCSHWSSFHFARALGVPVSLDELQQVMPAKSGGNSFADIADAVRQFGITVEGVRCNMNELESLKMPVILHLSNPDHFIAVMKIAEEEVVFFDSLGTRRHVPLSELSSRWTGNVIKESKTIQRAKINGGAMEFDSLYIDKGCIDLDAGKVRYSFTLRNAGNLLLSFDVATNCSCTVVENKHQELTPGESSEIVIDYSVNPLKTSFLESVNVVSNDPVHPAVQLEIAGHSRGGLRLSTKAINFGALAEGESPRTRQVFLRYATAEHAAGDWCSDVAWLTVKELEPVTPHEVENAIVNKAGKYMRYVVELHPALLDRTGQHRTELRFVSHSIGKEVLRLPVSCYIFSDTRHTADISN